MNQEDVSQEPVVTPLCERKLPEPRGVFSLAVIVDDADDLFRVRCWTLNFEP